MSKNKFFDDILKSKNIYYDIFLSPIGEIFIFGNEYFIIAIKFNMDDKLKRVITSKIEQKKTKEIINAYSYFSDYFNKKSIKLKKGKSQIFSASNSINIDLSCYTDKEIEVYNNLQKINSGETLSYKELGEKCGLKNAARFIGNTMAKNNFPIIIPCHRVIKSNGDMGNYSGGLYIKKFLIELEKNNS